jgi:outer membrane protein OmpA-like peptidoglycan-associated protein
MTRTPLALALIASLGFSVGCTSKKYVRQQTTPIIEKTNELDDLTAKNTSAIKDVDKRAQSGIQDVNQRAAAADQKAQAAGQQADQAQQLASQASSGVNTLQTTVANLDSYKPKVETSVHFGFNQDVLTKKAKEALDQLIAELPNAKHYIVTVEGGADAVGDKTYNYDLSERRADAVIQYLAANGNVPAHKIYLIGLGEDKPVADNKSSAGRAQNRRVDVRLMVNSLEENQTATASPSTTPPQPQK